MHTRTHARTCKLINMYCLTSCLTHEHLSRSPGLFGGGVLTYFCFMKWLFLLNVYIFILVFVFIAIPQMSFPNENNSTANVTSQTSSPNAIRAAQCSLRYVVVEPEGATVAQPFADFLQGTVSRQNLLGSFLSFGVV